MKKIALATLSLLLIFTAVAQDSTLKKKDRKRDVLLRTNQGDITLRLSDSTPLHRDNFLKLVKVGFYDSILFHRVIGKFMIQAGDPMSKNAPAGQALGSGGPGYRVPAEFRPSLFHKKGALAAARDNNPQKASSGSQFYIVQGIVYTESKLDSLEKTRLQRRLPDAHREAYKTIGGVPHLDQAYTVFGEVVKGLDVIDRIAAVPTSSGADRDRPIENVVIQKATLVKRKKK